MTTLAAVALVLAFAIAFRSRDGGALTVSATAGEHSVYAISYCGTSTETLQLLKDDLEYMHELGFGFTLPSALPELKNDAVLLIIENLQAPEAALELLDEYAAPAVVVPAEDITAETASKLLRLEDEGRVELAAYIGGVDSPWELAASIGEASLDFASRFGRPCRVFVHECKGVVCSSCFSGAGELPGDMTVFMFGNGRNVLKGGEKPLLMDRIMRLLDWSISSYFTEIAK